MSKFYVLPKHKYPNLIKSIIQTIQFFLYQSSSFSQEKTVLVILNNVSCYINQYNFFFPCWQVKLVHVCSSYQFIQFGIRSMWTTHAAAVYDSHCHRHSLVCTHGMLTFPHSSRSNILCDNNIKWVSNTPIHVATISFYFISIGTKCYQHGLSIFLKNHNSAKIYIYQIYFG